MRAPLSGKDNKYCSTLNSFRVPVQREEDDDHDDGVLFPWEDGQTLIADLSHDG